jgi:hypothetical protein
VDETEWLEGLLEACEGETMGKVGTVADFLRQRNGG